MVYTQIRGLESKDMWHKSSFRFILFLILTFLFCLRVEATVVNQLAYDVVHTQSRNSLDLHSYDVQSLAQTFKPETARLDGVAVFLDRLGLSNSADSVSLQLTTTDFSGLPTQVVLATACVKMSDIPDGNANRGDPQPDNLNSGYQVWFIFDQSLNLNPDSTYAFTLYAKRVDSDNQIVGFNGTDGYSGGSSYYLSTSDGRWTNYGSDLNFMTIKDKYSLVGIRRLPWNYRGAMTIESDIDYMSAPHYIDSLGRFLQTDQNVGGRWGKGVDGEIAVSNGWFWNAGSGVRESLGTLGEKVPIYFNETDTLSRYSGDSVDAWVERAWIRSAHTVGNTGYGAGGGPGLDSSHVFKALTYMQNHNLEKIYKAGVWVNHSSNYINTSKYGATPGTIYYHVNKTFAPGRFKFDWNDLTSSLFLYYYDIRSICDSLNVSKVIFSPTTMSDGVTRTYKFYRNGRYSEAAPELVYKWFNKTIAYSVTNNWQLFILYTHFGFDNGLTVESVDSIRAVYEVRDSLGLWIPDTKELLNQQAASAFAQVKVENIDGRRTLNITSLKDWSWGSHVPDPEELYYLTFNCFDAESLDVVINGTTKLESQKGKGFIEVKPDWSGSGNANAPMFWVSKSDRKFDKLMVIPGKAVPTNHAPVLDSIRAKSVNEGANLTFRVHATDADSNAITLTATNVPINASFADSGNGTGSFTFNPSYAESGTYNVTFKAIDPSLAVDSEVVAITVNNINNPPVLDSIGPKSVAEGQVLTFRIHATDINGDPLVLSALNIPTNATFLDSSNGSSSFIFSPSFTQSGMYNVTFIATDTVGAADSEVVSIAVVSAGNQAPMLDSIGSKSVNEAQVLTFRVHATDPDLDPLVLTAANLPANAVFSDSGNGSGAFTFSPTYTQSGIYNVAFTATDTAGAADIELVAITVTNVNNPPVLDSIGPESVNEGQVLSFRVHATDTNGDQLILSALNIPTNAVFIDSGSGSGSFGFSPNYIQSGIYDVGFLARDTAGLADTMMVEVTVVEAGNQRPVLVPIPDTIAVVSGTAKRDTLLLNVGATDPDGTVPQLYAQGLPANAAFIDQVNGFGLFSFVPDSCQSDSLYHILFIASDDTLADSLSVCMTVIWYRRGDSNRDGYVTVADVVFTIAYLFKSGPAPYPLQSGDANHDRETTVADCVYLVDFLFKGGSPP